MRHCGVGDAPSRVPVDFVFCYSKVFRNVIPDITVLGRSFVFSQSCLQVSASLPSISSLTVSTLDSVHRSLSVVSFVFEGLYGKEQFYSRVFFTKSSTIPIVRPSPASLELLTGSARPQDLTCAPRGFLAFGFASSPHAHS